METLQPIAQALANGLLIGSVYALISVGLTLIFGVMNIVNFAHGEFLMLGMFGAYFLSSTFGVDPLIGAPLIGIGGFLIGALAERLIIEPIVKAPQSAQIIATVGLGIILANGAAAIFGVNFLSVTTPYQGQNFAFLGLTFSASFLYAALYAAVMAALLSLFLNGTRFGKAMRATAQNRGAAQLLGIDPRRMYMVAFGLGVALVALAGAVILPYTIVYPFIGQQYVLIMFTVVVLGGLGSVRGAIIAGLVVGIIQSMSTLVLSSELQNLPVFIVFFLALVLIPGGVLKRVRNAIFKRNATLEAA
jgi:branched-chain amino acid transport system permease protein